MNTIDYTPVILAQLTDLQMRVTKQDTIITTLKAEIEKLSGKTFNMNDSINTMKTSIPLLHKPSFNMTNSGSHSGSHSAPYNKYTGCFERPSHTHQTSEKQYNRKMHTTTDTTRVKTRVPYTTKDVISDKSPAVISDILKDGEIVLIEIGTGKDSDGQFTNTTASAKFDGTFLEVTSCELVESLVGMKSIKPGEILYRFIDELKKNGTIKKTFSIAPWKLCYVTRNDKRMSLEELRMNIAG